MNRATLPAAGLLTLALAAPPVVAEPLSGLADPGHYVFVPSRSAAEVAIIDIREDRVVARLPVGRVPHQVVVADTLGRLATTNTADDTLSIVDLADLSTMATLALDLEPEHMELGPDGDLLAVGNLAAGTVSLVSLGEAREVRRVAGLHQPHNMTFSPDGRQLYVGNLGASFVSVVDVEAGAVVAEIAVGEPQLAATGAAPGAEGFQGIINVTRTPDGRLGFAAYGEGDRMAVIDLRTRATLATLELGSQPWRAFATADGRHMLVPNNGEATVSVISTATLEEVARLPGAADMIGVNTGWFETTAFVLSRSEEKAVILDLERMERVGELALPGTPETGVVTPDGTRLYVALSSTDRVAVIDVRERRLVKVIEDVGAEPWGAHMVGALNYCH